MDLRAVAELLQVDRKTVIKMIDDGVLVGRSTTRAFLAATAGEGGRRTVDDAQLDAFIAVFEADEPGRHPPAGVRRALLVEAGHRCAICQSHGPLEYHHILEWARVRHHDASHMLAACPTCHAKCGNGTIDPKSQRMYKENLVRFPRGESAFSLRLEWEDMREVIDALHQALPTSPAPNQARFDRDGMDLESKNRLNRMSDGYFERVRQDHEPYFHEVLEFLRSATNSEIRDVYYDLVDEIRGKTANVLNEGTPIDEVLLQLYDEAVASQADRLRPRRRTLNVLLSFMYVNCDIGRKA